MSELDQKTPAVTFIPITELVRALDELATVREAFETEFYKLSGVMNSVRQLSIYVPGGCSAFLSRLSDRIGETSYV